MSKLEKQSVIKRFVLKVIRLYQKTLSFDHGFLGKMYPNVRYCKHYPSCSEYGYQTIDKEGVLKGGWKTLKRVARCNPWTKAE